MAPKRGKGKRKAKKNTGVIAETRPESSPVNPPVGEDPQTEIEEVETRVEVPVEDPKGGGETPNKDTVEGGAVTAGEGGEDPDEFHDAREEGEEDEEGEGNVNKEKGKEVEASEGEEEEENQEGEEEEEENQEGEEEEEEEKANENANIEDETEGRELALPEPMRPLKMYFENNEEYGKPVKIITRCYNYKAVENLEKILHPEELRWFKEHPQFSHFFHMPRDTNHKSMGMWMLLLRTARIEKKKEAWFVVNGVPVRYSMREHALLSGLNCKEYPSNYKDFGNTNFVKKHFDSEKATYEEIRDKFLSMKSYTDSRLQMAVLYFLTNVIMGVPKQGPGAPSVDSLLLKYVSNLEWCKTFPWGRLTFEDNIKEIKHTMDSCCGVAKPIWCYPSFIIPLELLAFEAIPVLKKKFREEFGEASNGCPRMCKSKFKLSSLRGFTIGQINEALGKTKDIWSIVEPNLDELPLLMQNTEVDSYDCCDPVVDGWMKLLAERKKICFEELFKNDVDGRAKEHFNKEKDKGKGKRKGKEKQTVGSSGELRDIMEAGFKNLSELFASMDQSVTGKLQSLDRRMTIVEEVVGCKHAEEEEAKRKQEEEAKMQEEEEAKRQEEEEAKRQEEEEAKRQEEEEAKRQAEEDAEMENQGDGSEEEVEQAGKPKNPRKRDYSSYKKPVTRGSKQAKK